MKKKLSLQERKSHKQGLLTDRQEINKKIKENIENIKRK